MGLTNNFLFKIINFQYYYGLSLRGSSLHQYWKENLYLKSNLLMSFERSLWQTFWLSEEEINCKEGNPYDPPLWWLLHLLDSGGCGESLDGAPADVDELDGVVHLPPLAPRCWWSTLQCLHALTNWWCWGVWTVISW